MIKCDGIHEVITNKVWWTTWGKDAFDLNWQKNKGKLPLCEKCEEENWTVCSECGSLVENDWYGYGYLLGEEILGESLCPECAEKKGFERTAGIGSYPEYIEENYSTPPQKRSGPGREKNYRHPSIQQKIWGWLTRGRRC
jgi:hypothetical protein